MKREYNKLMLKLQKETREYKNFKHKKERYSKLKNKLQDIKGKR